VQRMGNAHAWRTDPAGVDVLPCDITTRPHVFGGDLVDYLTTMTCGAPGGWDPFTEVARVIDPLLWYSTSLDATPGRSVTRWIPPEGSGRPTVAVCVQGDERTALIEYGRRARR